MQMIARIMAGLLAVVTISGHGNAERMVVHAQSHHHDTAAHAAAGHHNALHDHDGHAHEAAGTAVAAAPASEGAAADCPHEPCGSDHSGPHVHMCCATVMALPASDVMLAPFAVMRVDLPIGDASLAAGELSYPLLRPPRDLI